MNKEHSLEDIVGGRVDSWFWGQEKRGLISTLSPISWENLQKSPNLSRPQVFLLAFIWEIREVKFSLYVLNSMVL